MRRSRPAVAYLLWCLLATANSAAGIPDRIQNVEDPSGPLIWISEDELDRELDHGKPIGSRLRSVEHLLGPLEGGSLRWTTMKYQTAADGTLICEPRDLIVGGSGTASDIRDLVELSRAILAVRVVGSKQGVGYGTGGTLLEVEVLSVLENVEPGEPDTTLPTVPHHGSASGPPVPVDDFYLFDRYARMVIDSQAYCLGTRQVPRGEFVLFFRDTWPDPRAPVPLLGLQGRALVAADGSFYGHLLDPYRAAPRDELARQMAQLEQTWQVRSHESRACLSSRPLLHRFQPHHFTIHGGLRQSFPFV